MSDFNLPKSLALLEKHVGHSVYPHKVDIKPDEIDFYFLNYDRVICTVKSNGEVSVAAQIYIDATWLNISSKHKTITTSEWLAWLFNH